MKNVLIFPAGTEIGKEIFMSLRNIKGIQLLLAGSDYDNHARHYDINYHILPSVNDSTWTAELQNLIQKEDIHYIFPAHDDALLALSDNRALFSANILCPSEAACNITRFKSRTYTELDGIVPVPLVYENEDEIETWPVFVKPDRGQGAVGAKRIDNREALALELSENNQLIISEFLPGEEYTVDCFTDRDKGLLYFQPRRRVRIRAGIAVSSELVMLQGIEQYAQAISTKLNLYGAWFFQIKASENGVLKVMEVAPRIAGTMALSRANGVNLPELTIYEHLRKELIIRPLSQVTCITRSLMNHYHLELNFKHAYIDYDDTVIINGKVNLQIVSMLYHFINNGVKIHLITKHLGDIYNSLKNYRMENLFDSVIHLTNADEKSDFIQYENSIFIDDSFSERKCVSERVRIPVFDVSMVEVLTHE